MNAHVEHELALPRRSCSQSKQQIEPRGREASDLRELASKPPGDEHEPFERKDERSHARPRSTTRANPRHKLAPPLPREKWVFGMAKIFFSRGRGVAADEIWVSGDSDEIAVR